MKTEISGACMGQGKRLRSTHREKRKRKGPDISLSEIGQSEQKEEIGNTIPSRSPTAQEGKPYILDILSIACMAGKDKRRIPEGTDPHLKQGEANPL